MTEPFFDPVAGEPPRRAEVLVNAPKYAVSQQVGFIKGKSAIDIAHRRKMNLVAGSGFEPLTSRL
jgi:hypothetical protein